MTDDDLNIEIFENPKNKKCHIVKIDDDIFCVYKSVFKNKKYDVRDDEGKYILSFGDNRYQHYEDKLKDWSELNHNDEKRRYNYRKRAEGIGNLDNPKSSNFWSYHFLW